MMWKLKSVFKGHNKAKAPTLPLDLLDRDFIANPYPIYNWLRQNQPVAPVKGGGVFLTRHSDITAALTDKRLANAPSRFAALASKNRSKYVAADLANNIPPFLDMPALKEIRVPISKAFNQCFRTFEDGLAPLAYEYVERASKSDSCDLVAEIGRPFAIECMSRFIGISHNADKLAQLSLSFFQLFAPITDPQKFKKTNEDLGQFRQLLATAMASPNKPSEHTFIGQMVALKTTNTDLSDAQIIDATILIFADGVENIRTGIANIMHTLPDNMAPVSKGDILEALRLDTPAQIIPRIAKEDLEIQGIAIKKDHPVFLALGSANRDEKCFTAPDEFSLDRDHADILVFGRSIHKCIGSQLATSQFFALMTALQRFGAQPVPKSKINYEPRFGHRWPQDYQIRFAK